jgi:hypothetical protein
VHQVEHDLVEKGELAAVGKPRVAVERSAALFVCVGERRVAELVVARGRFLLNHEVRIVVDAGVVNGRIESLSKLGDLGGVERPVQIGIYVRNFVNIVDSS